MTIKKRYEEHDSKTEDMLWRIYETLVHPPSLYYWKLFCRHLKIESLSGCWLWTGYLSKQYSGGRYGLWDCQGQRKFVNAWWAWWIYGIRSGSDPKRSDGIVMDHMGCPGTDKRGNPQCANPTHLKPAPPRENSLREGSHSITRMQYIKTECDHGHSFSDDNLVDSEDGYRRCKACYRERSKKFREENPETISAYGKKYREENKERLEVKTTAYREAAREKRKINGDEWPTQEELKALFDYDPDFYDPIEGPLTWRLSVGKAKAGSRAGCISSQNIEQKDQVRIVQIDNRHYTEHFLIFIWMTGSKPIGVEHANGNPLDNRWKNLRSLDTNYDHSKRSAAKDSKTGVKGVSSNGKRWRADCRGRYLGAFDTIEEAKAAYDKAAAEAYGKT